MTSVRSFLFHLEADPGEVSHRVREMKTRLDRFSELLSVAYIPFSLKAVLTGLISYSPKQA